jgi:hypothetical protein
MRDSRFLALLLISICIAPGVAQSAPKTPTLSPVPLEGKVPPLELGQNVPQLFSNGQAGKGGDQVPVPFQLSQGLSRNRMMLGPNSGLCYSMRSYGFTRDSAQSDATRLTSYSTCQSSSQFEAKYVVDPRPTTAR